MTKTELNEKIDNIFAPLAPHSKWLEYLHGGKMEDARVGSIMIERAWIDLCQVVESLLNM